LRERFLAGTAAAADYWRSPDDLARYDATFAERIGWKWDAVLRELALRRWQPKCRRVVDWGCGSGVAGRRVLAEWSSLASYSAHDRSPLAVQFATQQVRDRFPKVEIDPHIEVDADTLLVLSHVLSELSAPQLDDLLALADRAGAILWVEAGTHAESRRLIAVRERLRSRTTGGPPVPAEDHGPAARGTFTSIAPCTHAAPCGLLASENARHWCHHFARVPSEIFQDARWMEFGRELGIDLRSLPYCFLVLAREPPSPLENFSRILGKPRECKGHAKVLSCQADGVAEFMLQKRDAPALHKAVLRGDEAALFAWEIAEGKIVGGEKLASPSARAQPPRR
jgi:ribosomal protein RSM22 (predicted rRNA methylase)